MIGLAPTSGRMTCSSYMLRVCLPLLTTVLPHPTLGIPRVPSTRFPQSSEATMFEQKVGNVIVASSDPSGEVAKLLGLTDAPVPASLPSSSQQAQPAKQEDRTLPTHQALHHLPSVRCEHVG